MVILYRKAINIARVYLLPELDSKILFLKNTIYSSYRTCRNQATSLETLYWIVFVVPKGTMHTIEGENNHQYYLVVSSARHSNCFPG